MNKKVILLFSFLLGVFISYGQINRIESSIQQEASNQLQTYLNLIPVGSETKYGFKNRSDFQNVKVEKPYQIYYVGYQDNQLSFFSNEWRVPLSINGEYISLLTVKLNNGKPEVVDFGGNKLAQKIQEFEKLFGNDSCQHVMIRNTY